MWTAIGQALRLFAETIGLISKRNDLNNAPDVRRRAVQQSEADADSKTVKAIEERDLKTLRNEASE